MTLPQRQPQTVSAVSWEQFKRSFVWQQGEHVSNVGPTNSGKTTITFELLSRRSHVLFLATKPQDPTLSRYFKAHNYQRIKEWPPSPKATKVALWPPFVDSNSYKTQRAAFHTAINKAFGEGGWCIVIDEAYYLTDDLGLSTEMNMLWSQGRSAGISVVASTQRPRGVPRNMFVQPTHLFSFWFDDEQDIDRIAEIGSSKQQIIQQYVPLLPEHHFLYLRKQSTVSYISQVKR